MLKGGCFCGAIRYEAGGTPYYRTHCHCSICRRTTGAPFVSWFTVPRTEFRWVQGEPAQFRSTPEAVRSFCGRCGTQLAFKRNTLDELDITICSLDEPDSLPPQDHTFASSQLAWIKLADGLPAHAEARPEAHP